MHNLALLGVATIAVLLLVIMTKRMSPLIALILIPLVACLIGGFGWDTSKFIVSGLQSLAPVVGMFVFAILFFGIMTDAACWTRSSTASCAPSASGRRGSSWARRCWPC